MRVFSPGEVRLRSEDPLDDPVVEFRMLSDERDLVRLRDAVRRMIDIVRQPPSRRSPTASWRLTTPIDELDTDACHRRLALAATVNDYVHAVGTCRMGGPATRRAVVDTDCRVHRLRRAAGARRVGDARPPEGEHPPHHRGDRRALRPANANLRPPEPDRSGQASGPRSTLVTAAGSRFSRRRTAPANQENGPVGRVIRYASTLTRRSSCSICARRASGGNG